MCKLSILEQVIDPTGYLKSGGRRGYDGGHVCVCESWLLVYSDTLIIGEGKDEDSYLVQRERSMIAGIAVVICENITCAMSTITTLGACCVCVCVCACGRVCVRVCVFDLKVMYAGT